MTEELLALRAAWIAATEGDSNDDEHETAAAYIEALEAAVTPLTGPLDPEGQMRHYSVLSSLGTRTWHADDVDHAREQHDLAFPDEPIHDVRLVRFCSDPQSCEPTRV